MFLEAILMILAAATPAGAEEAKPLAQERCFCIQFNQKSPPPYFLAQLNTPECAGARYVPAGRGLLESGLVSCEDLKNCLEAPGKPSDKLKAVEQRRGEAGKGKAACCDAKGENCDKACAAKWDAVARYLSKEAERLSAERSKDMDACMARAKKDIKKTVRQLQVPKAKARGAYGGGR